jgi:Zn-dependent protease
MLLFQTPPPTRYDLNFVVLGIPVRVHPLFWLIAAIFGLSASLTGLVIWIAVVFVSITVHELGHALAFRHHGLNSSIILYWGGGLTVPEPVRWGYGSAGVSLRPNEEIFVSLAGPFAGFALAALVLAGAAAAGGAVVVDFLLWVLPFPVVLLPWGGPILQSLISTLLWVNIFWGYINLAPVFPLDGGNVTRYALLQADPLNGVRTSLWISVIAGATIAFVGLVFLGSLFLAVLFGFMAFQSYQSVRGRW